MRITRIKYNVQVLTLIICTETYDLEKEIYHNHNSTVCIKSMLLVNSLSSLVFLLFEMFTRNNDDVVRRYYPTARLYYIVQRRREYYTISKRISYVYAYYVYEMRRL